VTEAARATVVVLETETMLATAAVLVTEVAPAIALG